MKATDFLIEKLSAIFKSHSYLEIQYEFRGHIDTHIIEVRPLHCFESDKEYIHQQIILEDLFEELFPNQEIVFITDNPLLKIKNPILSLGISEINVNTSCVSQYDIFDKVDSKDYNDLIMDYLPQQPITYEELDIISDSHIFEEQNESVYIITKTEALPRLGIFSKIPLRLKKINKNYKKDSETSNPESFFFNIAI